MGRIDNLYGTRADDHVELRRSEDATRGAFQKIERTKEDVLRADGERAVLGQHPRELAASRLRERALLRLEVVDKKDASECEELLKNADFSRGQGGDVRRAAPDHERLGKE